MPPRQKGPQCASKRVILNCIPCRKRKIKCDRTWPICFSCQRRGMASRCAWIKDQDNDHSPSVDQYRNATEVQIENIVQKVIKQIGCSASLVSSSRLPATQASAGDVEIDHCSSEERELLTLFESLCEESESLRSKPRHFARWMKHLKAIPDRDFMLRIAMYYLDRVEPLENVLNRTLFLRELEQFWFTNGQNHSLVKDSVLIEKTIHPAPWISQKCCSFAALLLSIVVNTLYAAPKGSKLVTDILEGNDEDLQKVERIVQACLFFLEQSNYVSHPTLWSLQSMCLLRVHMANSIPNRECVLWQARLVRLAQTMGLNRLGSLDSDLRNCDKDNIFGGKYQEASSSNASDYTSVGHVTLDSGVDLTLLDVQKTISWDNMIECPSLVSRELSRKIWCSILRSDWLGLIDGCYVIQQRHCLTDPPANLDDEDVAQLDIKKQRVDSILSKRLDTKVSDATYSRVILRIANTVRRQNDLEWDRLRSTGTKLLEMTTAKVLEQEFQSILASLPDCIRRDGHAEYSIEVIHAHSLRPYLSIQRDIIMEQIYYRLLRAYSGHLILALQEDLHQHASKICVLAASDIIDIQSRMGASIDLFPTVFYLRYHLFAAVIVLHLFLCFGPEKTQRLPILALIEEALKSLSSSSNSPFKSETDVLRKPIETLCALYLAKHSRRATVNQERTAENRCISPERTRKVRDLCHPAKGHGNVISPVMEQEVRLGAVPNAQVDVLNFHPIDTAIDTMCEQPRTLSDNDGDTDMIQTHMFSAEEAGDEAQGEIPFCPSDPLGWFQSLELPNQVLDLDHLDFLKM